MGHPKKVVHGKNSCVQASHGAIGWHFDVKPAVESDSCGVSSDSSIGSTTKTACTWKLSRAALLSWGLRGHHRDRNNNRRGRWHGPHHLLMLVQFDLPLLHFVLLFQNFFQELLLDLGSHFSLHSISLLLLLELGHRRIHFFSLFLGLRFLFLIKNLVLLPQLYGLFVLFLFLVGFAVLCRLALGLFFLLIHISFHLQCLLLLHLSLHSSS